MVDLSRDSQGKTRAWLLDPFAGYKAAIDDKLHDAVAVLDAFQLVKLGTAIVDEVRRRVQQDTLGHRGRKGDPLYGVQTILRAGAENLTEKQRARLTAAMEADPAHDEVFVAWQRAQQLRSAYHQQHLAAGRRIAQECPGPVVARDRCQRAFSSDGRFAAVAPEWGVKR